MQARSLESHHSSFNSSETEQLKKRLAHLPEEKVDLDLTLKQDSNIRQYSLPNYDSGDSGTNAPLNWRESFLLVEGVKLLPKSQMKSLPTIQRNLYYGRSEISSIIYFSFFHMRESLCQGKPLPFFPTSSIAKMMLGVGEALTRYPDGSNSLVLCSINNTDEENYQLGTALIQAAVEFSLKIGLEGKVNLTQTGSLDFYVKLGFKQICSNGNAWYLPEQAIELWKERIAKMPLLTKLPDAVVTQFREKLNPELPIKEQQKKLSPSKASPGWFNRLFCCRRKPKAEITTEQSSIPLMKKNS